MPEVFLQINQADVVHDLIDGEAILINMTTGSYYSLEGSGAALWQILQAGPASPEVIVGQLALRFRGEPAQIHAEVLRILAEMQADGLLQAAAQAAERQPRQPDEQLLPFEPPVLNKYTDLEALLLLDPIHDVSPEGWPEQKKDEE